jgi:small GTP-binding protein
MMKLVEDDPLPSKDQLFQYPTHRRIVFDCDLSALNSDMEKPISSDSVLDSRNFLKAILSTMQPPQERPSVKAVLLGDSGVGKTSLTTRWITGLHHESPAITIGANHQRKRVVIDQEQVDIFLWDTAGQEQFQALAPLYVRNAAVAILTTAVNDRASFTNLDYWFNVLTTSTDAVPPVVLAVNKVDTLLDPGPAEDEIQATYLSQFAGVFFVSAITNEGVDNLFSFAAQAGYDFVKAKGPSQAVDLDKRNDGRGWCC